MIAIEKDIADKMTTTTAITDIVGDRIYPIHLLQSTSFPAISYIRISANRDDSRSQTGTTLYKATIQVSCWAKSEAQIIELANTVVDELDNTSEQLTNYKVTIFHRNDSIMYEQDNELYHAPIDLEVNYG